MPGLWNHEVVELFIAGAGAAYLEVELGPWGHHLVLQLAGVRQPIAQALPMSVSTRRCGDQHWTGEARIPRAWLPAGPHRVNAYWISGVGERRVYGCHEPLPGSHPDFHQPDRFVPVELPLGACPDAAQRAAAVLGGRPQPSDGDDADAWGRSVIASLRAAAATPRP
jgi:hypothetical protein